MENTMEETEGVIKLLDLLRVYNPKIGSYIKHYPAEGSKLLVHLDNGKIKVSKTFASYIEKDYLPTTNTLKEMSKMFTRERN